MLIDSLVSCIPDRTLWRRLHNSAATRIPREYYYYYLKLEPESLGMRDSQFDSVPWDAAKKALLTRSISSYLLHHKLFSASPRHPDHNHNDHATTRGYHCCIKRIPDFDGYLHPFADYHADANASNHHNFDQHADIYGSEYYNPYSD